jgi:hypothetical protein
MPRSEARISVDIWATGSDFTDLEPLTQWMYLFLLSQPDLTHAGVLALRERRWSQKAKGLTVATITQLLGQLQTRRFVVVDEDTEEVLIRSFIRRDKVYRQPNVLRAAFDQLQLISSPLLRRELAQELHRVQRLEMPEPSVPIVADMLAVLADEGMTTPDPSGKGSGKGSAGESPGDEGSGNPSGMTTAHPPGERGTLRSYVTGSPSPVPRIPESSDPLSPGDASGVAAREPRNSKRGTRLPENFTVTEEMKAWARQHTPLAGITDHEMFMDHWRGQSGQRAVKADWVATWRNWMRRVQENKSRPTYGRPTGPQRPPVDDKVDDAKARGARLQAQHDQHERRAIGS